MPRENGILYPKIERIKLDGGLNTKFPKANIADNESPDCLNVVYSAGAVETRGGTQKFNTAAIAATFACDGIYTRRQSNGTEELIAFGNNRMWKADVFNSFSSVSSANSVFSSGRRIGTAQYIDYIFMGNGNGQPYKYDGTYFTRHGVTAPNSGPTAASAATGVLTGGYRYKITYVNSMSVESDTNTATSTFTAASATIGLTSIPVAPQSFGVAARRIYRTEAGGASYKYVAEISNNTATTYSDTTPDGLLSIAAPVDNGEPPDWSVATYHQGRLWMNDVANVGFVWYSEIGNPFTVESTSFLRVGDASTDTVIGLHVHQNSILVACENSLWLIYLASADPNDWSIIRIKSQFGTLSPWCIVSVQENTMFAATSRGKFVGFATIGGNAVAPDVTLTTEGSSGSELTSQRIEPDMFSVTELEYLWRNMSAIVWKNRVWFSVPYGDDVTYNSRVYVYDFSIEQVAPDNRPAWAPFTGFNAYQFTIYDKKLFYFADNNSGFAYEADTTTYSDDGVAIDSYAWTKEYYGNHNDAHLHKDFRSFYALVENAGDWDMSIFSRTDSDRSLGTQYTFNLEPAGYRWGVFVYGRDLWGGGSQQQDIAQTLGNAKGRRIQFKFTNQNLVDQYFKVHNFAFSYNIRGER